MALEERSARLTVSVSRGGRSNPDVYTFEQHRMRINLQQGGGRFGNLQALVYGVPLAAMNRIARIWTEPMKPDNQDRVTLDVWSPKGFVPLFEGSITWSPINAAGLPHVALEIQAQAALVGMNTSASPYAEGGPVALREVLAILAKKANLSLVWADNLPGYQCVNVRVTGTPVEQITSLLDGYPDVAWFINLSQLVVRAALAPLGGPPVRIAADTGMIGYPTYSSSGIQLATLFNASLTPGVQLDVHTEFEFINRTVWVASVLAHQLDVNVPGGQWYTQIAANSYGTKGNAHD